MMHLHAICALLHAPAPQKENIEFTGISIDSRTLQAGHLFIAIRGTRFDGHAYLAQAIQQGARAAVVDHPIETTLPLIIVPNTTHALGVIAQAWRQQFSLPVVALTGSCGKTTTKSILAHILEQIAPTLSTQGTLNNEIGVPLTLLQLTQQHQFAVIELGTNHPGEIAYIAGLTQPNIALITNITPVHLAGFGSLAGIAAEKSTLYNALSKNGIAILNQADAFFSEFKQQNSQRTCLSFGLHPHNDVYATHCHTTTAGFPAFTLHYRQETGDVVLPLLGQHNILNALAAACAALALSIPFTAVQTGLCTVKAVNKRMNKRTTFNGVTLIDDTYNANPTAFLAAIDFLLQQKGKKILVVGDMGELGPDAAFYHAQLGQQAKEKGVDYLFAVGELSSHTVEAFGENAKHFLDKPSLIRYLRQMMNPEHILLVKGSRSAKMEEVVEGLL